MLRKLHSLKTRRNNRKERGRKGLTLVLLLMFAYKKNWKEISESDSNHSLFDSV